MVLASCLFFFLMIRRPPRSTLSSSSAASDVYKRQVHGAGTWGSQSASKIYNFIAVELLQEMLYSKRSKGGGKDFQSDQYLNLDIKTFNPVIIKFGYCFALLASPFLLITSPTHSASGFCSIMDQQNFFASELLH
eukprot:TRINITY_DN1473_c0_g1_i2.p1 TRINITY_DN1473_c0_g1~~TRINITY_DN1473_c0_g1_i2.p1  ORF type:complete len:135 (+),score=19.19 TRINITY_DN1473_c0_g1_i2:45-449(+)